VHLFRNVTQTAVVSCFVLDLYYKAFKITDMKFHSRPVLYEKQAESQTSQGTSVATYAAGAAVALTSNALFPLYELGLKER